MTIKSWLRNTQLIQRFGMWAVGERVAKLQKSMVAMRGKLGGVSSALSREKEAGRYLLNEIDEYSDAVHKLQGRCQYDKQRIQGLEKELARCNVEEWSSRFDNLHKKYAAVERENDLMRRKLRAEQFSIWSLLPEDSQARQLHGFIRSGRGDATRHEQLTRPHTVHISGKTEYH